MADRNEVSALGLDDVLRLEFVPAADLSPDGRRVVYAVTRADVEAEQDRVALHLLDVETGAPQVFVISPDGGEARQVTELEHGVSGTPAWSTPTLLVQGEGDLRCPAEQSEQFYAVLQANGCVVEMLRIPNSSHTGTVVGAIPARRAQNEALLDWMDRYVMAVEPAAT